MTGQPTIVGTWLDGDACAVDVREAWALTEAEGRAIYRAARDEGLGACLVSTCFRVELLVSGTRPAESLLAWGRRQLRAARPDAPADGFREGTGDDALRHVFRVAAGLESAVLGEAQILGQIRRARAAAEAAGVLRPALRQTLGAAIRTGQWARRVTDLGRGTASTASAAVQWADEATGGLAGRHVVVMGAGQIGRLVLDRLATAETAGLTLISAHAPAHAGFGVVRPEDLAAVLPGVEVVITATDRRALDAETAARAWADGRPRVVVDLGVPRNVDDAVGSLPGVRLADVDALGAVVDAGLAARQAAVPEVEAAIEDALYLVRAELDGLRREALIADLRRQAEQVRRETVDQVCGRCRDRTCQPAPGRAARCSDPDGLTQTLTTRLFHDLTASLRQRQDGLDEDALRRLFALDRADG